MNPLDQQIQRLTALKQKRRHLLSEVKSGSKSSSSAAREHLETRLGDKSRRSLQDLWRKQKQQQVLRPHIQGLGMVRQDYLSKIRQLEEKRDDPWQKLQDKLATSFRIAPPQTRKQLFGVIKQNNTWTNPKTGKKQQHRFYSPDTNRLFMTRLLQFLQENNPQLKDRLLEKQQVISQPPVSGNVMGFLTPYQAGKLGAMNTALRGSYAQSQPGMKQLDTATLAKKKDRVSFLRNLGKFKDTLQVITLANNAPNARLTAEQVEALASALPALTNLTHLVLSNNPIGEQGAVALANALRQLPQLKHLDLFGISLSQGQGASALADALRQLTQLTYLSLGNNKIGDPGITALANSIKTLTNLRELRLSNMNIGNSTLIIGGLLGALRQLTQLKHLDMSNNPLGTNALHGLLSHMPNLQVLDLAGTHLGDQGVGTLVHHHLGRLTHLTHLDLRSNNIGDQGASALAGALRQLTHLTYLNLGHNNIENQGASALAGVLPNLTQLTDLDLRKNNIGDQEGAVALAGALRHLTHLKKLDLNYNKFGDRGASALAGVLPSLTKLQNLSLMEGNSIGAPGALAMARSFSRLSNFS